MANPQYGNTPGAFVNIGESFTVTNSTILRVIVDTYAASGTLTGGCRVMDLVATSTDGTARSLNLYDGVVLTSQSIGATGTITVTGQNVITRATGSYITDGWRVGHGIILSALVAPAVATAANGSDGVYAIITGVTATTLTVNGTPLTNETLQVGTRLAKAVLRPQVSVAINAGSSNTASQIIASSNDATRDTLGFEFGTNGMLFAGMVSAVSALPAQVFLDGRLGLR